MGDLDRKQGTEVNVSGLDGAGAEQRAGVTQSEELQVDDGPADNLLTGQKNVTVAGTAESMMGAATPTRSLTIKAKRSNTGLIYVGPSTVTSANGHILSRGQSMDMELDNSADEVYVDASVSGDGVSFAALDKAT